jgi:hypothetical protein
MVKKIVLLLVVVFVIVTLRNIFINIQTNRFIGGVVNVYYSINDCVNMKIIKNKLYNSPRWAFMKRQLIGTEDNKYLDRIYIIQTPWFGIMFHKIYRPDNQRDLHDHPWNFLSLILHGSYKEQTLDGIKHCKWFNLKKAEDRHAVCEVNKKPVWTLVFTGKRQRVWGFWVDKGTRFVPWTQYDKLDDA